MRVIDKKFFRRSGENQMREYLIFLLEKSPWQNVNIVI